MFALPSDGQLGRATCSTSDKTVCHNLNLPKCDIHFIDSVMKLPWYNALNVILYQDLSIVNHEQVTVKFQSFLPRCPAAVSTRCFQNILNFTTSNYRQKFGQNVMLNLF